MKRTHIILACMTFLFAGHIQASPEIAQNAQKNEKVSIPRSSDWKQSVLELLTGFGSGVAGICLKRAVSSVFSHMASADGSFPTLLGSIVLPWALSATVGTTISQQFPIFSQNNVKYAAMIGMFCAPLLPAFDATDLTNIL